MALHVASVAPVQRSTEGRDRGPTLDSDVRVAIEGDSLGGIAVGHHINQVGSVHGDYIVANAAGNFPAPTPRTRPIDRRGRDFPDLIGRREEIRAVQRAARAGRPVELIAPPGMGKSALLRHLAFRLPTLPDGVVWLSAANRPYDDLLEKLFDAFFQTSLPVKLNADDLLRHLSGINALLLVDDVDLSRDEVGALLAALPQAALVLASNERRLRGEGHAIPLGGLALDEGMTLFTRQVGRSLRPHEEGEVRRLVAFGGSPLAIKQSALAGLVVPELRIVAALAALDGAPTQLEHLTAVVCPDNAVPFLRRLAERGLIEQMPDNSYRDNGCRDDSYRLAGGIAWLLAGQDFSPWRDWWIGQYAPWASFQRQTSPALLLRDTDAIRTLIRWAARAGRHRDVIRLTRAIEPALTLDRQWRAWSEIMELARGAAVAARLPAAEAWALHQQGTRALLEGQTDAARAALERALDMRRALGDRMGAELTRYHLALMLLPPPLPSASNVSGGLAFGLVAGAGLSSGVKGTLALLGLFVLLGLGLLGWWHSGFAAESPPTFTPVAATIEVAEAGKGGGVPAPLPPTDTPVPLPTDTLAPPPTDTPVPLPTATLTPLPTNTPAPTLPLPTPSPLPLPTSSVNDPPLVQIFRPGHEQRFHANELISFGAAIVDSEDEPIDSTLAWYSSLDGHLSSAAQFTGALSPGQHRLTVRAVDGLGRPGEASITIYVDPPPDSAPMLTLEAPGSGAVLVAGQVIVLRATAGDPLDGDISQHVIWRSERDGVLGRGAELRRSFVAGEHVIIAAVTDAGGQMTEQRVTLVVMPADSPPVVTLVQPVVGVPLEAGVAVAVVGAATDAEDGNVAPQLQWFLNDASQPVGQGESFELQLPPGSYRLRATVSDSAGNAGQATVEFVVPGGPDVVITLQSVDVVQKAGDQFSIPVLLVVTNRGDKTADAFEITAEYTVNGLTAGAQLGEASPYIFTSGPLAPGESFRYTGQVLILARRELYGQTISLSVMADSCRGDEGFGPTCRVAESDEGNNRAPIVDVILPAGLN